MIIKKLKLWLATGCEAKAAAEVGSRPVPVGDICILCICDPSQQNRAVVCYQEKCEIPFI